MTGNKNFSETSVGRYSLALYELSDEAKVISEIEKQVISLVNLIADKEVVKELIQQDLTVANMVSELDSVLSEEGTAIMKQNYIDLKDLLGGVGASERISSAIVRDLKSIVKTL